MRLRDLDGDGRCELIAGHPGQNAIFRWLPESKRWSCLPFKLPDGVSIVDELGRDNGLRFVDIDEDGRDDIIFSNENRYGLYLFTSMEQGWSQAVRSGTRPAPDASSGASCAAPRSRPPGRRRQSVSRSRHGDGSTDTSSDWAGS